MEMIKVVVRCKNGSVKKGTTNNFFPNKNIFHLKLLNGEVEDIDIEELKAIFFVKDFEGNKNRKDMYNDVIPGGGRKVQVKFYDDEILIGYTQGYSPRRTGFFMLPADIGNNNERVYVISSATEKITFL